MTTKYYCITYFYFLLSVLLTVLAYRTCAEYWPSDTYKTNQFAVVEDVSHKPRKQCFVHRDRKFIWNRKRPKREEAAGHQYIPVSAHNQLLSTSGDWGCLLCFIGEEAKKYFIHNLLDFPASAQNIKKTTSETNIIIVLHKSKTPQHVTMMVCIQRVWVFLPWILIRHFGEQMRIYNQVSAKFCSKPPKSWWDYEKQHLSLDLCWAERSSWK